MKQNKLLLILPVLIALAVAFGVLMGVKMAEASSIQLFNDASSNENHKLNQVLNYIKSDYVDTIQEKQIIESTISQILQNLDPHSSYISGERFNEVNDPLEGNFDGIGIEFNILKDTVIVVKPIPGGPSEKIGVMAGDRIIDVDGESIADGTISNQKVMKLLKGPKSTKVKVGIYRPILKDRIEFEIVRAEIPINSVESYYMLNESIAYIKLIRFARNTHEEFINACNELKNAGMKELIIDLRNNSGGYLNAATEIANEFLEKGSLIVYTEGKARTRHDFIAKGNAKFKNLKTLILINEGSASASEILAGAMQDNDRGIIVGRRSFGKGLVQEPMQWSDGSQIRLTVARYYTPTGRSIQKSYEDLENYDNEYFNRYEKGELFSKDSIQFPDSLKFTTPAGKIVYGGGGIMPDVFVALDTSGVSAQFAQLNYRGLFYQFGFHYVDQHRSDIVNNYQELSFEKNWNANEFVLNDFVKFVKERGIDLDNLGEDKELIQLRIKAAIGRNLFGNSVFYKLLNKEDQTILKAQELIETKKAIAN